MSTTTYRLGLGCLNRRAAREIRGLVEVVWVEWLQEREGPAEGGQTGRGKGLSLCQMDGRPR